MPPASPIIVRLIQTALLLAALLAPVHAAVEFDATHALFDQVLKRHVRNARVDYAGLKARPDDLHRYLAQVAAVTRAEFTNWSEPEQLAFLCNAYNAYTLRLILAHYPVKSIKQIGGVFSGPWDQPAVELFGGTRTLDDLEHKIIRKEYAEPRIHFALVCAALGCPPLRDEAYTGVRLESQLADQAKRFLAETGKNRIAPGERTIYLSPIFQWYGADFEKSAGTVTKALQRYWPGGLAETGQLNLEGFRIRYTDYDWSLNDLAP